MPNYRRALAPGASWFFTVNLLERRGNDLLVRHIDVLRTAVRSVHRLHPFTINARVVLPEHMHCVWTLPPGDADYSLRWRLIKTFFRTCCIRHCKLNASPSCGAFCCLEVANRCMADRHPYDGIAEGASVACRERGKADQFVGWISEA